MAIIDVRPTIASQDLLPLCEDIRTEDRIESLMFTGQPLRKAVARAILISSKCFTVTVDGLPAVIFGVAQLPGNPKMGSVWMRTANRVSQCLLYVIKESPKYLQEFLKDYPGGLYAAPMAENNDLHLRWLRLVGFQPHHWIYQNNTPFQVMTYV